MCFHRPENSVFNPMVIDPQMMKQTLVSVNFIELSVRYLDDTSAVKKIPKMWSV